MSEPTRMRTAELWDAHGTDVHVVDLLLRDFGSKRYFFGVISTVRAPEDNTFVRKALEEPGKGSVLVVDGGGSMRCALVGDQLAALAIENGWEGIIVNGCVRDSELIASMPIGVKALGTTPRRCAKRNEGERDLPVRFGGVTFIPGHSVYADPDGVLVSPKSFSP